MHVHQYKSGFDCLEYVTVWRKNIVIILVLKAKAIGLEHSRLYDRCTHLQAYVYALLLLFQPIKIICILTCLNVVVVVVVVVVLKEVVF